MLVLITVFFLLSSPTVVCKERPVLTLVSQQNVYAFEGMDVFFEAQVKAGPYSWVSLSHVWESNENVIQRTFNVSSQILMKIPSITKANSGDYVLYAENAVGNDTVTVRLYVEDIPDRSSSPPPAPEIIDVRIHQEVLLQGSLRHLQYGMLIGWFSCPTPDCNEDWNKHWIADIRFMEKVILENPHYSAFLNGTLLIKKVLPMFNGRYFIRRVRTASGDEPNIYHLKVVQEHPVLTLDSQQNIYAFEGMDVFFEAQVKAYPYPWVSLSHVLESNKSIIQRTSNVSSRILMKIPSITKANSGDYVLYAENAVGNDTVTVRVYVESIPGRSSSPPLDTPTSLSSSGPGDISASEAPKPTHSAPSDTSSKDVEFLTALRNPFVLALLISLLLICIVLVLVLITILSKPRYCHQNQRTQDEFEIDIDGNIPTTRSNKRNAKAQVTCVAKSNFSFDIEVLSHSDCELSDLV